MSSSPAISLVKPLGKPVRACPYCDHVSPADSKFCGACGAALHLVPCPNCGAVNDITSVTACYRCHHELADAMAPATPALAAPELQVGNSPLPVDALAAEPDSAARQRPHTAAVFIVLVAFAAASYYAYRQRSLLDGREPAAAAAEAKDSANASAGAINKVPAPALAPAPAVTEKPLAAPEASLAASPANAVSNSEKKGATPPVSAAPSVPASASPAPAPPPVTSTRRTRAIRDAEAAALRTPAPSPATEVPMARGAASGIQTQPPRIGPCTDAVAALGLCTRDATPSPPTSQPTQKRP